MFSYSSIKTFEQCPKKYYHLKIAKDVNDTPGEAANYGTAVHTAAEEFFLHDKPIPDKYAYMRPIMERLATMPGDVYTEIKMGVRKLANGAYRACDFDHPKYWWHGIADLLIVDGYRAWMIDYKTGKSARYADLRQLDLMAGAVFALFPQVMQIDSALLFVVSNEVVDKTHVRIDMNRYLSVFDDQLERLEIAKERNVWNAKSSGLCGWCPVEECLHWRDRSGR